MGDIGHNGYTNDDTPTLNGTISAALGAGEKLVIMRDGAVVAEITFTGTKWSWTDSGLFDGESYTYTVRVEDAAGNRGAISDGFTINVDMSAPTQVTTIDYIWDDVEPSVGKVGPGETTNDSQPELHGSISGSLANNEYVAIYRDGVKIGEAKVEGTTWTFVDDTGLTNGQSYNYTAQVEDRAGNEGPKSNDYGMTLKTDGPTTFVTIETITDDVDPVQGVVDHKGYTNDTTPLLEGTMSVRLGPGEFVAVYRNGVFIGKATPSGTNWRFADKDLVDGETYTYTVRIEDAAGNFGADSNSYEITIDTTAPSQVITLVRGIDNVEAVVGDIVDGSTINDDTPTFEGTISSPLTGTEKVYIIRNGEIIGEATMKPGGLGWIFTDGGLANGETYTYSAVIIDAAGNRGTPSGSLTFTLNTDGVSQTVEILKIMDDVDPNVGKIEPNGFTNDKTPTLVGSVGSDLSAGDVVEIYRDGKFVGNATIDANGRTWTFTDNIADDGSYSYTAVIKNAAGDKGSQSNPYVINVDTTDPSATVEIEKFLDNEDPITGEFLTGAVTNDTTPLLIGTIHGTLEPGEKIVIFRDGVRIGEATLDGKGGWTFQDGGLKDGTYIYTAYVEDAAGNHGTPSFGFDIIVDTTAPSATVEIDKYLDDYAPQTGYFESGSYTNDVTPTLILSVKGTLEAGEVVSVYRDGVKIGEATYDAKLGWTFTDKDLENGKSYTYTAYIEDAAGNLGVPSGDFIINVDTSAPTQSVTITDIQDDLLPQTGLVKPGEYTNDTTPTLNGTIKDPLGAGEKLVILRNGEVVAEITFTGTGWSWTDAGLEDGKSYIYTARVEDAAGNRGAISNSYEIKIDTSAPTQTIEITGIWDDVEPYTGRIEKNGTTNDSTPELKGTIEGKELALNEYIAIYRDGVKVGEASVNGTTWSWTDKTGALVSDQSYKYEARVEDRAGNQGAVSDDYTIKLVLTGPATTTVITDIQDNVDPQTGLVKPGEYTNDTTPTLNGTISAALKAGETIVIYRTDSSGNVVKVGTGTVTGSSGGVIKWTFTDSNLVDGEHYSYTARVEDAASNPGPDSNAYDIYVDTAVPSQTVILDHIWDNADPVTGAITPGGTTNDDTPTLHGTISTPLTGTEKVYILRDGVIIGEATMKSDGLGWSFEDSGLSSGSTYKYEAVVKDAAGNSSGTSNSITITINTDQPPEGASITHIWDDLEPVIGDIGPNGSTNDNTPMLEGSVLFELKADEVLVIYRNGQEVATITFTDKTWKWTDSLVAEGPYTYEVAIRNSAGTEGGKSGAYTITYDVTPPSATAEILVFHDDFAPETGDFQSGAVTNDTTPLLKGEVKGTLEKGDVVAIYRDGVRIGEAKVSADGKTWSFQDGGLADGESYTYVAYVEDAAGNKSTPSGDFVIIVDTTPPSATVAIEQYYDDYAPQTGYFDSDTYTNDTTPKLILKVDGTLAVGEVVSVYRDGVKIGEATFDSGLGKWTFEDKDLENGKSYTYTAYVEDAAGNLGAPSGDFIIHIDTSAPTQSVRITDIQDNVDPLTGKVEPGEYTNDTTPTLNGTIADNLGVGEKLVILRNGQIVAEITFTGTSWSWTDAGLEDGKSYIYEARVEDAAGNRGAVSNPYEIIVDTSAPTQTIKITDIMDDVEPFTGRVESGGTTNDSTPELKGSIEGKELALNEYIAIYRDGVKIGEATLDGKTWSFTDRTGLENGKSYTYTAQVEDRAGNKGTVSNDYSMTLQTDGPDTVTKITDIMDDVAPETGRVDNGGWTNDTTPLLVGTISEGLKAGETIVIYRTDSSGNIVKVGTGTVTSSSGGVIKWEFTDKNLIDGESYKYMARVEDAAGNQGTDSNSYEIKIDTTAPEHKVTIIEIYDDAEPNVGGIIDGGDTNDDTPTLTGTISKPLTGTEKVYIIRNGEIIGEATMKDGTTWTYQDSGLASGGSYKYEAIVKDAAGNTSNASNSWSINVNTDEPPGGVRILSIYDNVEPQTGKVISGGSTNDPSPVLEGSVINKLTEGQVLVIYRNGKEVGTVAASEFNEYTWTWKDTTGLSAEGKYVYTAAIRNPGGNMGDTSPEYTIIYDVTPPSATAEVVEFHDDFAPVTGDFKSGAVTNDTTPLLKGEVKGTLEAGDVVVIYRDGVKLGNATVSNDGLSWTFQDGGLEDGKSYNYTAIVEDKAGNQSTPSGNFVINVDTTPPSATVTIDTYTDDQAPQTGKYGTDTYTNDTTPTLNLLIATGSVAADEKVVVYRDGVKVGYATYDAATGWTFTDKDLENGKSYNYTAYVEDAAGNLGKVSNSFVINVDTQAPTQSVTITDVQDDQLPYTGSVKTGEYTNDTSPMLKGEIGAPLGAGEKLVILRNGEVVAEITFTGESWSWTDANLEDGKSYTYTARVEDAAGNRGAISNSYEVKIDTSIPTQTIKIDYIWDDVEPSTGDIGNNGTTNDSTPELRGTIEGGALAPNEYIAIYRDGVKVGEVTVVNGTQWVWTDNTGALVSDQKYKYEARVEDRAGNQGAVSNDYSITLVLTGPKTTTTIDDIQDNVDPQTGLVKPGDYTNDTTPTLNGTISAALKTGETVTIYRTDSSGNVVKVGTGTIVAGSNGVKWTFTDSNLADGEHYTYMARVEDAASNPGANSNAYDIYIDTTSPSQTVKLEYIWDDADPVTGQITPGGTTNDDTPTLHGTISSPLTGTEKVYILRDGVIIGEATMKPGGLGWTYEDSGLSNGSTYKYEAVVKDAAGNSSATSGSITITINTDQPPEGASITKIWDDVEPQTGDIGPNGHTNDDTPTLEGTVQFPLKADEVLVIYRNGKEITTITFDKTTWFWTDALVAEGDYTYEVAIRNTAGTEGGKSGAYTITLDKTPPSAWADILTFRDDFDPVTGDLVSGSYTNDTTPRLNGEVKGTLGAGEVVVIYRDGVKIGTATVNTADNTWTFQDGGLKDGNSYTYVAYVEDKAGNKSTPSGNFIINVDTTPPTDKTPTIDTFLDDFGSLTGNFTSGTVTDDTTPRLNGSLNLALDAGEIVVIYRTNMTTGEKVRLGVATITNDPSNKKWVYQDGNLDNNTTYKYEAYVEDAAGNQGYKSNDFTLTVQTDVTTITPYINSYDDDVDPATGTYYTGSTTNDTAPLLNGSLSIPLEAGMRLEIWRDGVKLTGGTLTMKDSTTWTYQDSGLTDGEHSYVAKVVDAVGNEFDSNNFLMTVDTKDPIATATITSFIDDQEPIVGEIKESGKTTNDTTPLLKGEIKGTIGADEVVAVYRNNVKIGEATIDPNDSQKWTYQDKDLADGDYTYHVRVEDRAGNYSQKSPDFLIKVDTIDPLATVTIHSYEDDQLPEVGTYYSNSYTNDTSPLLKGNIIGTVGSDEVIAIYRDGVKVGEAKITGEGKTWEYQDSGLSEGQHKYVARVEDGSGNWGKPPSNEFIINVDITKPEVTVTIDNFYDDVAPGIDKYPSGTTTNDTSPLLNGKYVGTLGDGEVIAIYRDGVKIGEATVKAGNEWEYQDDNVAKGDHTYIARVEDRAGNQGPPSADFIIKVDTDTPETKADVLSYYDNEDPVQGTFGTGTTTNDQSPLLNGKIVGDMNAGDVVAIYRDGVRIGVATTLTSTTWEYQDNNVAEGTHKYEAYVENAAGVPGPKGAELTLTVDITPPVVIPEIVSYTDNVGADRGDFLSGTTTDDRNPILNGKVSSLAEGEVVNIYEGNKLIGTATITGDAPDGKKTWSLELPPLEDGSTHTYTSKVVDAAGNASPASNDFTISVDLTIIINSQNTTDTTPVITGSTGFDIQPGEYLEITVGGVTYSSKNGVVEIDFANNTWALQIPDNGALLASKNGIYYDIEAKLKDADGKVITTDDSHNELLVKELVVKIDIPPSDDPANKATAVTIGEDGGWRIFSNMNILDAAGTDITSIGVFNSNQLYGNEGVLGSITFMDFNRNGLMDLFGMDSSYWDGQQAFEYKGKGYVQDKIPGPTATANNGKVNYDYYAFQVGNAEDPYPYRKASVDYSGGGNESANVWAWYAATVAYDKSGTGWAGLVVGDNTPNDSYGGGGLNTSIIYNDKGIFKKDPSIIAGASTTGDANQAQPQKVITAVDLGNTGVVNFVYGAAALYSHITGKTGVTANTSRMVIGSADSTGTLKVTQIVENTLYDRSGYVYDGQSMTFADFDGDGYVDLFQPMHYNGTGNSIIMFNDNGRISAKSTNATTGIDTGYGRSYVFSDNMKGGGTVAVDWDADGKMDIIEIPYYPGSTPAANQNVLLFTNKTANGVVDFSQQTLTTVPRLLSPPSGGTATAAGSTITGLISIDIDWNGAKDLILFTHTKGAFTVVNETKIDYGTSLHLKVLDHEGINSFFGNVVKLYDSKGNLVSTQVLNPQAGNQTNDSTGIVDFYGLDANETYSAVLVRAVSGVAQHIGGAKVVGDYTIADGNINAAWSNLKATEAYDAHVLTAEGANAVNNANHANGIVGTGYNDTFYATKGSDIFTGGGGSVIVSGERVWSDTGGIDMVSYQHAGLTSGVTVDLSVKTAQTVGSQMAHTFINIEGIIGTEYGDTFTDNEGDNVFNGRGGNDTFNLSHGGRDTLLYEVISNLDATGGNGSDQVNNFTVGNYLATPNADRIDIQDLLIGYQMDVDGPAHWINGVATIDAGDKITDYLSVTHSGGNTILNIDRDGAGSGFGMTAILTINNETVDLATLLANHQIIVG